MESTDNLADSLADMPTGDRLTVGDYVQSHDALTRLAQVSLCAVAAAKVLNLAVQYSKVVADYNQKKDALIMELGVEQPPAAGGGAGRTWAFAEDTIGEYRARLQALADEAAPAYVTKLTLADLGDGPGTISANDLLALQKAFA